jgi:Na+-transporting NADH:ubiquinone oxidoreductase subunit A
MSKTIRIKRGVDIKLKGTAKKEIGQFETPRLYALKPSNFHGLRPKLAVKEGQEVKAGQPLFFSKDDERIKFCSPVSGEVAEIVRGEKRRILEIRVLADKEVKYESYGKLSADALSREQVVDLLLKSGAWPFIVQRPYGVLANPDQKPKSIFISAYNTAPLSSDVHFALNGKDADFQAGIDALAKLTDGGIHIGVPAKGSLASAIKNAKGVQLHAFEGPHPAGNVGVMIHHVDPINKGERVWTISPQDVVTIGKLFSQGIFDPIRTVALAGSCVTNPKYYEVRLGSQLSNLLEGQLGQIKPRVISGNVYTGEQVEQDGFFSFNSQEINVIPEGDEPEFLGWVLPGFGKFSLSRAYFSWLAPNREYDINTNMRGEERAYVMTGQYEEVFPFDIYPQYLIKSIMTGDVEKMEQLGIYEVVEEDLALCEVVCTSKIPVQKTIRQGLDLARKELG